MPRRSRKRPYGQPHEPLDLARATGGERIETGPRGLSYRVRSIPAGSKAYVCPGCELDIPAGESHVVAWTVEAPWGYAVGVDSRRHWHRSCWERARRST